MPPDAPLWFHMLSTSVCLCVAQQSLSKLPNDKSRSKRSKEPKPRVKKLKYHQYIPPDRKQELSEVPMDSAYARLLQQQQQFLQLQILSQQQFNFQPSPAANVKYGCFNTNAARMHTHVLCTCKQANRPLLFSDMTDLLHPSKLHDEEWIAVQMSCLNCTPFLWFSVTADPQLRRRPAVLASFWLQLLRPPMRRARPTANQIICQPSWMR